VAETLFAQLAREPIPGRVKTRLLPALSSDAAARLHSAMVYRICQTLCGSGLGAVQLWVDGNPDAPLFDACRRLGLQGVHAQRGDDLGDRMRHISERGFAGGFDRVVLVGSDAPSLTSNYLLEVVQRLDEAEVVFAPALDGGYVLVAMNRHVVQLFGDIPWGGEQVLSLSLQRLDAARVRYALLSPLPDIDRPEDLRHLPASLADYLER
jgi:rSAM/selenodomain-associated transferase 1